MAIPGFLQPVVQYYTAYGPVLIVLSLVLGITYLFISNFASVRSAYMCTSLKNVLTGNVGKCFGSRLGPTCKTSDIGFTHGWCNDEDNYGPLRGTRAGPYSVRCKDWIWNKSACPPNQCNKINGTEWGWCADKGVQRAMRGQACGPYEGSCDTWIWQANACPTQCGSPNCKDDSCICTMVRARYVIVKRSDDKDEYINLKQIEVYDSNGYKIKGIRPTLWPVYSDKYGPDKVLSGSSFAHTGKSKNAYVQLDLGDDKPIGRVVITNRADCCKDRMVGCSLILRKNDNSIAMFRKITDIQAVYNIPIGKAKPVQAPLTQTATVVTTPVPARPNAPATTISKAPGPASSATTISKAPAPSPAGPAKPVRTWKQIPGKLKSVSGDNGWTWGVNASNDIYKCRSPCDGKWEHVPGKLKQIDVGGAQVWGVSPIDQIFWRSKAGEGQWHNVGGKLKHVSVGPTNRVWGVNTRDDIFMCKSVPCRGDWHQVPGKLKQVDVTATEVWGVNANNDIYKRPAGPLGSWKQVPGKLKYVSATDKRVVGVNSDDNIYTCKQPCNGNWKQLKGNLKQVEVGANTLIGVNREDNIYRRV
jgi:hypothetical protein